MSKKIYFAVLFGLIAAFSFFLIAKGIIPIVRAQSGSCTISVSGTGTSRNVFVSYNVPWSDSSNTGGVVNCGNDQKFWCSPTPVNSGSCSGTCTYSSEGTYTITTNIKKIGYDRISCSKSVTIGAAPSCTNECSSVGKKECVDSTSYRECGNYDEDTCLEWKTSNCPSGQTCSNGECVSQVSQCTETGDGGKDYFKKGTVAVNGTTYTDYCQNSSRLIEYYCSGNEMMLEVYSCPYGCENGVCKEAPSGAIEDTTPITWKLFDAVYKATNFTYLEPEVALWEIQNWSNKFAGTSAPSIPTAVPLAERRRLVEDFIRALPSNVGYLVRLEKRSHGGYPEVKKDWDWYETPYVYIWTATPEEMETLKNSVLRDWSWRYLFLMGAERASEHNRRFPNLRTATVQGVSVEYGLSSERVDGGDYLCREDVCRGATIKEYFQRGAEEAKRWVEVWDYRPLKGGAPVVQNHPASGTLSVSPQTAKVGETITLTISGEDQDGLEKVCFQSSSTGEQCKPCTGVSDTKTWSFAESEPGTYTYYGYVYGTKPDGTQERVSTTPRSVTVKVTKTGPTPTENHPVSGTLSVSPQTAKVGQTITLTVTGKDEDGVTKVYTYYQGKWHSQSCQGTECTKSFTFSESQPGEYKYYGYVFGTKPDGTKEGTWTEPGSLSSPLTVKITKEEGPPPVGENDPVSGSLSAVPSSVSIGEGFEITVSGQDSQGVIAVYTYFKDHWHSYSCNGQTQCSHTWTNSESRTGDYRYYGYVLGTKPDGTKEAAWTKPGSKGLPLIVKVTKQGITPVPSGAKVHLPQCPFSDTKGIWAKNIWCTWDKRCNLSLASGEKWVSDCFQKCSSVGLINSIATRRGHTSKGAVDSVSYLAVTKNIKLWAFARTFDLCTTDSSFLEGLPTCPFSGNTGDVWVKPDIPTVCNWKSHSCKVGTNCTKKCINFGLGDWKVDIPILGKRTIPINTAIEVKTYANRPGGAYTGIDLTGVGWIPIGASVCIVRKEGGLPPARENDPVSGTLSAVPSSAFVNEKFEITVSGQDDQGVEAIYAYFKDLWHKFSCNHQTQCSHTWTNSESRTGEYRYYGYVLGTKPDGTKEAAWTELGSKSLPLTVKITQQGITPVPTGAKVHLPQCPFSDSQGVWAKNKSCTWEDRCMVAENCGGGCGKNKANMIVTGEGRSSKRSVFTNWKVFARGAELCTINPSFIDALPACQFSGNKGDVWARPDIPLVCNWSQHGCKLGTDCQRTCINLKDVIKFKIGNIPIEIPVEAGIRVRTWADHPGKVYCAVKPFEQSVPCSICVVK